MYHLHRRDSDGRFAELATVSSFGCDRPELLYQVRFGSHHAFNKWTFLHLKLPPCPACEGKTSSEFTNHGRSQAMRLDHLSLLACPRDLSIGSHDLAAS